MRKLRWLKNDLAPNLCLALVLVLTTLSPTVKPAYADAANERPELPSSPVKALPTWWGNEETDPTADAVLPGWWRPFSYRTERMKGPKAVAAPRPSAAVEAFSATVDARVGDNGHVGPILTTYAAVAGQVVSPKTSTGLTLTAYPYAADARAAAAPELTLTLGAFPSPVDAGSLLTYQILYENQGPGPVNGLRITMTYDAHVTFVSASRPPITGADNVWDIGRVKGGTAGDVDILVAVDENMHDLYTLTTSATINSDEVGPLSAAEATVVHAPVLKLTKSAAPDPALADDQLLYTLVYSNSGHADVYGLVITDAVPIHTGFARCQPLPCGHSDGIVNWEVGNLAAQTSQTATLLVDVNRNVDSGTALTNTARVWLIDTPAYSATTQITTSVVSSPSLRLTIDNERASVEAGDRLTYTITYTNDGDGKAYDVRIAARPPSSDAAQDPGCAPPSECVLKDGVLIYGVGTVPGGTSDTVSMLVAVRDPLPADARAITASVVISTVTPGDPVENNYAEDVDEIASRPDLSVTPHYEEWMPWPGKRVTYTLEYKNEGHIGATGVVVTATRPPHTRFKTFASDPCWVLLGGGHYRCLLGALDSGESGELAFVVTLPGTLFTLDTTEFDTIFAIGDDRGNGSVSEAPLGVPNLVIEDVVVESEVWQGKPGWLTATVRNEGSGMACNNHKPDDCTYFWLDLFLNPEVPPASFPIERAGNCFDKVDAVPPGETAVTVISFTVDSRIWYNQGYCGLPPPKPSGQPALSEIWLKVDNWDPTFEPESEDFGLVAEYDEFDNVWLETPGYKVFIPLVYKNHSH